MARNGIDQVRVMKDRIDERRLSLKIAHFIETDIPGGAEQVMLKLCKALIADGHTPIVCHFGHCWIKDKCNENDILQLDISPISKYKSKYTLILFCIRFAYQLRKHGVDLLHTHLFGPTVAGAFASSLAGIPHLATMHDTYVVEESYLRSVLLKIAAACGTQFIAVSKSMESFYKNEAKLPRRSITTIYNGIELDPDQRSASPTTRAELGICADDIVAICVGRLVPLKRVPTVISTCVSVMAENPRLKLLVVGDGPEFEQCRKAALAGAGVSLLGHRSDVADLLKIADIYIQYSTTEGLSMALLEAASSGLLCIASDVGGNAEIIEDQVSGYLIAPDSEIALRDKLETCIARGDHQRLGDRAKQQVESKFSDQQCSERYFTIYREMISQRLAS